MTSPGAKPQIRWFVGLLVTLALPAIAAGQPTLSTDPSATAQQKLAALTEIYKHLHRNPELSKHEEKTSVFLADQLRKLGYSVTEKVGVYAEGADRLREQMKDVDRAIEDVDYRAANVRAGYMYVISNIGSFGERMVKIGMTRRLDPMERIRELSDASVPFNFDVHALFFSKDAVGIETSMHARMAEARVNSVNLRREFFYATPGEAKLHLAELAGELLQFEDLPEALEYRQGLTNRKAAPSVVQEPSA